MKYHYSKIWLLRMWGFPENSRRRTGTNTTEVCRKRYAFFFWRPRTTGKCKIMSDGLQLAGLTALGLALALALALSAAAESAESTGAWLALAALAFAAVLGLVLLESPAPLPLPPPPPPPPPLPLHAAAAPRPRTSASASASPPQQAAAAEEAYDCAWYKPILHVVLLILTDLLL